jgi:hypothetical protein
MRWSSPTSARLKRVRPPGKTIHALATNSTQAHEPEIPAGFEAWTWRYEPRSIDEVVRWSRTEHKVPPCTVLTFRFNFQRLPENPLELVFGLALARPTRINLTLAAQGLWQRGPKFDWDLSLDMDMPITPKPFVARSYSLKLPYFAVYSLVIGFGLALLVT